MRNYACWTCTPFELLLGFAFSARVAVNSNLLRRPRLERIERYHDSVCAVNFNFLVNVEQGDINGDGIPDRFTQTNRQWNGGWEQEPDTGAYSYSYDGESVSTDPGFVNAGLGARPDPGALIKPTAQDLEIARATACKLRAAGSSQADLADLLHRLLDCSLE